MLNRESFSKFLKDKSNREDLDSSYELFTNTIDVLLDGYKNENKLLEIRAMQTSNEKSSIHIDNIEFISLCEHHIIPFIGKVNITYTPGKKLLGLGDFKKIVDIYSHRLQIQERLTEEIFISIDTILNPKALEIEIEAKHLCTYIENGSFNGNEIRTKRVKKL